MPACARPALVAIALFAGTTARAFIDNGVLASPGQFPYVVHLTSTDPPLDCTGTIIGPNTVLTAAHCVLGLGPKNPQMSIHLPDGRTVPVAGFLAHPGSDSRRMESLPFGSHDSEDVMKSKGLEYLRLAKSELAIVKPAPGVQFTQWAEIDSSPPAPGQQVTLVGYGMNDKRSHDGNGPLRYGTNQLQWESRGVLFFAGRYYNNIGPDYSEKADGQQASPDQGDSGGPLFSNRGLIGVVVASQEPAMMGEGYGTFNRALGAATGHSLNRTDDLLWCFYAAINDSENLGFLTKTAAEQGYQIAWAQQNAPIAPPPTRAPTLKSSPAFNALQSGDFGR